MPDFIFRLSFHRPLGIEDMAAVFIKHRSLIASEIILQRKACPTVLQFGLHEFRVLFVLAFYFSHR